MEDNKSSGSRSTGPQLPDSNHRRNQSTQSLQAESQSSSKESTSPSQSNQSPKSASSARRIKLLASIETLKSNISTTEAQLSMKLREITQLKSFPALTSNDNNTVYSSRQGSAPVPAQNQRNFSIVASNSGEAQKAALSHAQSIIDRHISLLKSYNEIKDIAMGMLGLIAEKEGRRLKEVMDERGVDERD